MPARRCVPVFLDEQTADEYYNGFCNSVLWPLFHYVVDVLDTSPLQTQWSAYVRANEAFAAELLEMVQEGDIPIYILFVRRPTT